MRMQTDMVRGRATAMVEVAEEMEAVHPQQILSCKKPRGGRRKRGEPWHSNPDMHHLPDGNIHISNPTTIMVIDKITEIFEEVHHLRIESVVGVVAEVEVEIWGDGIEIGIETVIITVIEIRCTIASAIDTIQRITDPTKVQKILTGAEEVDGSDIHTHREDKNMEAVSQVGSTVAAVRIDREEGGRDHRCPPAPVRDPGLYPDRGLDSNPNPHRDHHNRDHGHPDHFRDQDLAKDSRRGVEIENVIEIATAVEEDQDRQVPIAIIRIDHQGMVVGAVVVVLLGGEGMIAIDMVDRGGAVVQVAPGV